MKLINSYYQNVTKVIQDIPIEEVVALALMIENSELTNNQIFILGNGGSNSIATHFAADLNKINIDYGRNFKIHCLGQNSSLSTMLSNDYGYEYTFALELQSLAVPGDLLLTISSSGESVNVLNALSYSKKASVDAFAMIGFLNSTCEKYVEHFLNLNLPKGSYQFAEDVHSIILHSVVNYLSDKLGSKKPTISREFD